MERGLIKKAEHLHYVLGQLFHDDYHEAKSISDQLIYSGLDMEVENLSLNEGDLNTFQDFLDNYLGNFFD